ncbi:flagellin N-terminal helical domain-containing protein [Ferribacterium limneticum]|uniref:flagellin N-terminal helical domain-containing protein n=1 Tax=Ferribacterium limneticum TaxID=76259 RepID=UPI001CFA92C3|nr:flagellin [Ferribacterium limneticum]UCV27641.1 flagellin FliC [Ferribacterium limneticum]UCV31558.1 flagellin FliC [Ferribacterium limneticum]
MAQVINTNVASLNAQRNLLSSKGDLSQALQRLSSGLRVNSAKDDAAGLAIAERMKSQSMGMNVGIRNANDGISMMQTAEAGLGVMAGHLQRMRELATQASSGQYSDTDRSKLDAEFQQLQSEVARVATSTKFNGKAIIAGSAGSYTFQVGAANATTDQISATTSDLSTVYSGSAIATSAGAVSAMDALSTAIDTLNTSRANLGSYQSRFEGVISALSASVENTDAARSRIMDTDYAAETAKLSRAQILQQAGTAMLAQANALPQNVLSLIQ